MKKTSILAGALFLLTFTVSHGFANDVIIHGCYQKSSRQLRVVTDPAGCKNNEVYLYWNQVGPQGKQGVAGPIGPQGPQGYSGVTGLSCWDLDGDDYCDLEDDINNDGTCDALDCQGPQGPPGSAGEVKKTTIELCKLYDSLGNINLGIEIPLPSLCFNCPNNKIEPLEQCDDGNITNGDGCNSDCKLEGCGNGLIEYYSNEECDDGNLDDGDGCSSSCTIEYKTVFVTSQSFDGNLGGLAGADAKCNELASNAGLEGEYKAWLSDSTTDVSERFSRVGTYISTGGYNTDYEIIANNWDDLTDGSLENPIYYDENGDYVSQAAVWTNTSYLDGARFYWNNTYYTCNDWNEASSYKKASYGITAYYSTGPIWTQAGTDTCSAQKRLYCFEQ